MKIADTVLQAARSRRTRGIILTRNAILLFQFGEDFIHIAPLAIPGLLQALANSLKNVGLGGDVQQPLVAFGILNQPSPCL